MSYSGEVFIFQQLAKLSKGSYFVPQNPLQVQYFLNKFIYPPIANEQPVKEVVRSQPREVRRIGFPKQCKDNVLMLVYELIYSCLVYVPVICVSVNGITNVPIV